MTSSGSAAARFPILDDTAAIARVREAVTARKPFSFVRIGDGEAVVLSIDESAWLHDVEYLHSHWGAERVTLGAVAEVRQGLLDGLASADLVGVRGDVVNEPAPEDILDRSLRETGTFVRSHFPLRPRELEILSDRGARRLAMVNRVINRHPWRPEQEFCSAWLHWELLASGALNELLGEVDEIGLVTSKTELGEIIADRFGIRVTTVSVPEKYNQQPIAGAHVPDRYRTIRDDLQFAAGTLVLVGGGIPAKAYCHWVKEAGGVAVDIGSVLDAWTGKASRPLVLQSRFGAAGDSVPEHLRLGTAAPPSARQLTPRWKPEALV